MTVRNPGIRRAASGCAAIASCRKVSMPSFVTVDGGTDYANHGEYVEAMGGGSIAAQKCVGMPMKSKAPKA
jgi:hypothetical protein